MKTNKVFLGILVLVFVALMMASTLAFTEPLKLKVVMLFANPITSEAWNLNCFKGLMRAKEDFDVDILYQESVSDGEFPGVLRSSIMEGADLIIVNELYRTEPTLEMAEQYPDTMFAVCYGTKGADNVASVGGTNWEANCLSGAVAGAMTETNTVGFMIATDSPIAHNYLNAGFIYGARWTNPEVKVLTTYVGSWDDILKGKELVISMIDAGVDIVYSQSGKANQIAVQVCEGKGVWAIVTPSNDMIDVAPKTVVAVSTLVADEIVYGIVEDMVKGNLQGGLVVKGIKEGVEDIYFNPLLIDKVPENGIERVMELRQKIIDGEVTIEKIREELTKENIIF